MLTKKNRLAKKKDFERVYRRGKSFFSREMGIKAIKNNLDVSRFGFVASLKVSKKAVERNRIKRRLREIVRKALPRLESGFDCVILTRPEIKELKYQELGERAMMILGRMGVLKK